MTINLRIPDIRELKPRITVFGVGGAGGNAVNNMITAGLQGVDFVVANTDAQALTMSKAERIIQMGAQVTEGLGAGSQPDVGRAAAEEVIDEIRDHLSGAHMVFVTAGMGGGTGTGAAPIIAKAAQEVGILTVGVVTKPFHFEGQRRMRVAEGGIVELQKCVDTLLIIPNQNLFRVANEKTTFADAFAMADQVLYSGVACITDLMVKEGLINLDFADVRAVMREMGKAMMGTGEAEGEKRASTAAEAAISNPLIDDASMKGAKGLLISITGGRDLTLYEVDEAATRIRERGRPGCQHHRRRDLRRESRRHHPRFGGRDRDRQRLGATAGSVGGGGADRGGCAAAARRQRAAGGTHRTNGGGPAPHRRSAGFRQRLDRIGQGGGCRGPAAAERWTRRHHPSARSQAVVVYRSGLQAGRSRTSRKRLFRRSRNACRSAPCACRGSMSCRSRRRTRFAPGAASSRRRSIRRSGGCPCCSGWQRSVWAAASRSRRNRSQACGAHRRHRWPLPRRWRRNRRPNGLPDARSRALNRARTRSPTMPNVPRRRGWTSTDGRRLCITAARRISWTFRRSCAGRRIKPR